MLQATRPGVRGLQVKDDLIGHALLPASQELGAEVGNVAEVPVEAAAGHFQLRRHRADLQRPGAVLRQRPQAVPYPVGLCQPVVHAAPYTSVLTGQSPHPMFHTEVYGHDWQDAALGLAGIIGSGVAVVHGVLVQRLMVRPIERLAGRAASPRRCEGWCRRSCSSAPSTGWSAAWP